MACYPERKKGRHTGTWIAEVRLVGRKVRERFETQREGDLWAARVKAMGEVPSGPRRVMGKTFGEVAHECREAGGPKKGKWRRGRDKSVLQRLDFVIDMLGADTPIADIDTPFLRRMCGDLGRRPGRDGKSRLAPATINRYLTAASAVLTFASSQGYIKGAPEVPWLEEDGQRLFWLTAEQEDAVVSHMLTEGQTADALCVRALVATGMRWGEFASLEPEQIEDAWVRLWRTKTDTPRSVPIEQSLARNLRALVAVGGIPKYQTFRKHLKSAAKVAGQLAGLSVHSLRHTTASRLVERGVNLAIVQKYLGHKRVTTTMRYTHISDDTLLDAHKKLAHPAGHQGAQVVEVDFTHANLTY